MAETLPMTIADAETFLRLTLLVFRERLKRDDREFLEEAMRRYGHFCVAEASAELSDMGHSDDLAVLPPPRS